MSSQTYKPVHDSTFGRLDVQVNTTRYKKFVIIFFMKDQLQVFSDPENGPSWNMAVDELLFQSLYSGFGSPFVRFYRWKPWSLSFGLFQKITRMVDLKLAVSAGIGLVRRMSGGKAVFHGEEVTFSAGFPISVLECHTGGKRSFLELFRVVLTPLINALRGLGFDVRFSSEVEVSRGDPVSVHCYSAAVGHSVYLGNQKLIGAAGIMKEGCLFVHGSIPLGRSKVPEGVFIGERASRRVPDMAVLSKIPGHSFLEVIPEVSAEAFGLFFGFDPVSAILSDKLSGKVFEVAGSKYSDLEWPEKLKG